MSNGKNQQKKRKRHSSSRFKSQIAIRLEKLRNRPRDLWGDDDDDDNHGRSKRSKMIDLSDSDEEKPSSSSSKRRSRKSNSHNHVKNATCLICSILSQLSSYNCCSEHLSILKKTHSSQWLPEQVMIVPVTNEIVQRYLDPQQIQHLRTQTSTTIGKSVNKSTMTLDLSGSQQPPVTKSPQKDMLPIASTIVVEAARSNSATIPPDITTAPIKSIINTIDTVTIIDLDHQTITIDASHQENISNRRIHDPWIPISDEIEAALEQALDQIDSSSDTPLEFTPTTVRRTDTEFMAACLPKIPLKQGRFRQGKPIIGRPTTNAANEYRPLAAAAQSSPLTASVLNNTANESDINENIFTQDEPTRLPTITRTNDLDMESNGANGISPVTSLTTANEKATPSRISYRMNPDGTRVSISRPPLPTNHSLRRTSTDVTSIPKQV